MKRVICCRQWFLVSFTILAMGCLFAFSAIAASKVGPAGMAFYTPPATLPDTNGDLIWYRTSKSAPPESPACNSWQIMYRSKDAFGMPNVVTGTVLVPRTTWRASYPRPMITYAVGTHGLAQSWAPSLQLANGTDYENVNIRAALQKGYAVLITDNPGYTNGSSPTYMSGIAQGHAALDIIKAALQIPYIGLSSSAKIGIWGYSQGGQTAAWAGQLQPSYAPNMNLVGVAAGGVPANFFRVSEYIDGKNGSAFLLDTVIGLSTQYPEGIPLALMTNDAGKSAIQGAKNMGVFEALFTFMNVRLSSYIGHGDYIPISILSSISPIKETMEAQNLGKTPINVPVFLYHGTSDEFIELNQALDLKKAYCDQGVNVSYMYFPGEHLTTQFQAAPYALSWLQDRFNGKFAASTCNSTTPRPVSTANPVDGDFVVSMNKWNLAGTIHLKTLRQDVYLPGASTFSANTNMTINTIVGSTEIPDFPSNINVILPLKVNLSIVPAKPMTGTASIDKDGILHVHGKMYVNLYIKQVGALGIKIPFKLHGAEPIVFPIDYDGPASALGDGTLTFKGTTTFPRLVGNGSLINALFTTLMSGPGQKFAFTITPPLPKKW